MDNNIFDSLRENDDQRGRFFKFLKPAISARKKIELGFDEDDYSYQNGYNREYPIGDFGDVPEFSVGEVDIQTCKMFTIKDSCEYCRHGLTTSAIFKLKEHDSWIVINNWCGCLTYDAEWKFKECTTKLEAYVYLTKIRRNLIEYAENFDGFQYFSGRILKNYINAKDLIDAHCEVLTSSCSKCKYGNTTSALYKVRQNLWVVIHNWCGEYNALMKYDIDNWKGTYHLSLKFQKFTQKVKAYEFFFQRHQSEF